MDAANQFDHSSLCESAELHLDSPMQQAEGHQPSAAVDGRVLDGISVAALLAVAVLFMWLIR